jgi:hypothetical protein
VGRRWHESAGGDLQRSSNMSSSAEYGLQIVAVVTKLIGGDLHFLLQIKILRSFIL